MLTTLCNISDEMPATLHGGLSKAVHHHMLAKQGRKDLVKILYKIADRTQHKWGMYSVDLLIDGCANLEVPLSGFYLSEIYTSSYKRTYPFTSQGQP